MHKSKSRIIVGCSRIRSKDLYFFGAVHKSRHPIRGYGGVSQKGEGIWQKMTDDDDEAWGRREKTLTALYKTL